MRNRKRDTELDRKVQEMLRGECEGVSASEQLKARIDEKICVEMEEKTMRTISMKKVAAGVAAACLLVSGAVFAGNPSTWISSSPSMPEYQTFAEMGKAEEKLGYTVDYVESFANGYTFAGASVDKTQVLDEEKNVLYQYNEIGIDYKRGNDAKLFLSCNNREEGPEEKKEPDAVRTYGGITLAYDIFENHFVTTDYVITEKDRELMEKENIIYSVGTDENEVQTLSKVRWNKDGVYYSLSGFDVNLSADDLLDMAQEIIDGQ